MPLRLIINADDIGMTPGVTQGIVECMTEGVVTSASFMPNMPSATAAVPLIKRYDLKVGVHLNLTTGQPISSVARVPSLVDSGGQFHSQTSLIRRLAQFRISSEEIYREFSAQIDAAIQMGIRPTHIDTHHHTHLLWPVARVMVRVARDFGILKTRTLLTGDMIFPSSALTLRRCMIHGLKSFTVRTLKRQFRMADWRMEPESNPYGGNGTSCHLDRWLDFINLLSRLPPDCVVEVPRHPAYIDEELRRSAAYVDAREEERIVLKNSELKNALSQAGIRLISYAEL